MQTAPAPRPLPDPIVRLCDPARARAEDRLRPYTAWLTATERARLARTGHRETAELFVVARGLLRELVGELLGLPPGRVRLGYDALGKPLLTGPVAPAGWEISISHTLGLVAVVVADRAVGIDVQQVSARDHEAIARRVLTPGERRALAAAGDPLSEPARRHFYALWTAKEAWMKARGQGFGLPPRACEVRRVDGRLDLVGLPPDDDPARWRLRSWWPGSEHAAALVTRSLPGRERGRRAGGAGSRAHA